MRGIPEPAILQEMSGRSSWESLESVARLLRDRGLTRVLLVSDPSHSMRIKGIAEELGLDAFTSPTVVDEPVGRLAKEATGVALGRIIGYGRLGELSGCAQCASLIGWARTIPVRGDPARSRWRPASRPPTTRRGAERRSPSPRRRLGQRSGERARWPHPGQRLVRLRTATSGVAARPIAQ